MNPVTWVLARAAEQGIAEGIIPAATKCDVFLRSSIKKKALAIIEDAKKQTTVQDEAHVIRLAFLRSARVQVDPNDTAAVERAFAQAKLSYPKRRWLFPPVTFTVLLVFFVGGFAALIISALPNKRDRFADSAVGQAFGEGVTDYVAGVSHRDGDRIEKGRKLLRARGVKSQIGDTGYNALEEALSSTMKVSEALSPGEADRERERLDQSLRTLDQQLVAKKVPALLDEHSENGYEGTRIWLLGYYVDQRVDATIGGETIRIAWGRRLDTLNLDVGGTVYRSDALDMSIVALDEIEGYVAQRIVPGLGKARPLPTGTSPAQELTALGRAEKKAGEKIRAELLPIAGWSEDDGTEIGDLLTQRHQAFLRLSALGDELVEPRSLKMSERLHRALVRRENEVDAKEILRIDERLQRGALVKGFDAITSVQAALDERFWIHHEYAAKKVFNATLGDAEEAVGRPKLDLNPSTKLAALLGSIADSERTTTALCELGQSNGMVPLLAMYLIERELGSAPTWMKNSYLSDDEDAVRAYTDALSRSNADIRKAAGTAYQKMFGEPVPSVTRKPK